jgi:2-aminoadipate transaminase
MSDAQSVYSDLARSGPPLFFPDPPAPVTFNLDQGIASEESFPIDQLRRVLADVLDRPMPLSAVCSSGRANAS